MKKLTAGALFLLVLVSSLPWEGMVASGRTDSSLVLQVAVESQSSPKSSVPQSSPAEDGCSLLCPLSPGPVLGPSAFPTGSSFHHPPGVRVAVPNTPEPHLSSELSRIFHPPRIG